jgi:hypothetical protein
MRTKFVRRKYMATVKRIGPGSAFKVGAALYAFMGLFIGLIFALVSMVGGALMPASQTGAFRMFFGAGAIIFLPIFYGVIGGIFAALGALIYNLVAGWFGGLEVDIN